MDRNQQQRDDDQWMTDGPSFDSGAAEAPAVTEDADLASAESGTGVDPDLAGVESDVEAPAPDTVTRDADTGVPSV